MKKIEALGHTVVFLQKESGSIEEPETYDGVICNGLFLHHDIAAFTKLRYIQLTSAGVDRVPIEYVKQHNIVIHNARGVYSVPMAEFAVCGVLQLYKQSQFFMQKQETHQWEKHRGLMELYGKTVCVVGCGSVGDECAKRFAAFGCCVFGVDIAPSKKAEYEKIYPIRQMGEVLIQSDVVVLTLPLTQETYHLFDEACFAKMKEATVLVNIARGAIVDTKALIAALKDKLFGAVLDVFEEEPLPPDSSLWDMDNVIFTPHNSFVGEGNAERLFAVIYENLKEFEEL
ncbi:MAG: NAD(P)-dependent oxidoreductase [Clostridia bacterium]|nr:NAD(P)-dependent oxidoreductase [Clostridia bacterium]